MAGRRRSWQAAPLGAAGPGGGHKAPPGATELSPYAVGPERSWAEAARKAAGRAERGHPSDEQSAAIKGAATRRRASKRYEPSRSGRSEWWPAAPSRHKEVVIGTLTEWSGCR